MFFAPSNAVRVPKHLESVTSLDPKSEVKPTDVNMTRDGVEAIWRSAENYYRTGLHPGMTLVIRRKGQIVLKRAIGHARGDLPDAKEPDVLMKPDTPICLFSASKAVTAMLIHSLAEKGLINLDAPVAHYIPEFGVNGKAETTVRHVLSHRAGVASIPIKNPDPSLLYQWNNVISLLSTTQASHAPGEKQAYHAITGGYILGEIARRVTGRELNPLLQDTFSTPLGCNYFTYGLPEARHADVATNHNTGGPGVLPVQMIAKRVLGVDFSKISAISNQSDFVSSIIPAGNIYANADEVSRFYQMLLNKGEWNGQQLIQADTVKAALKPVAPLTLDGMLLIPMRYSSGMMLGESFMSLYGPKAPKAFGHLGLLNIVCWADPQRDIAVSFLNTGKTVDIRGFTGMLKVIWAINKHCGVLS